MLRRKTKEKCFSFNQFYKMFLIGNCTIIIQLYSNIITNQNLEKRYKRDYELMAMGPLIKSHTYKKEPIHDLCSILL